METSSRPRPSRGKGEASKVWPRLSGTRKPRVSDRMSWTFDEINREWLHRTPVALSAEELVTGFERGEQMLGRDWIDRVGASARRASPTLEGAELALKRPAPH